MLRSLKSSIARSGARSNGGAAIMLAGMLALPTFIISSDAEAVTLTSAGESRGAFAFPLGDVTKSSYDGPAFDAFKPFQAFTGSDILQLTSFTGQPQGSKLETFLLSEFAAFDGTYGGSANNFGVVDSVGNFVSLIDTAAIDPGGAGSLTQLPNEELTFALQSPEGFFSSVDKDNEDGAAHMLALQVTNPGEVTIDVTDLQGSGPLSFQLLEGDIIIFVEDMKARGNIISGLVPFDSDFDYNDLVFVVRQTEIPEPASVFLLGSALVGFGARSRKRRKA